jgi:hypothetical protein
LFVRYVNGLRSLGGDSDAFSSRLIAVTTKAADEPDAASNPTRAAAEPEPRRGVASRWRL